MIPSEPGIKKIEPASDRGLLQYLAVEQENATKSRVNYQPELESVCRLFDLYNFMAAAIKVDSLPLSLAAELFLVVNSQLCGSVSQLLRLRVIDVHGMNRRTIEATAIAYRLWKHQNLVPVYIDGYPHIGDDNHPKQWRPSKKYKEEFSTGRLFSEEGEIWLSLKKLYDVNSAMATHAGMGALTPHEHRDQSIYLPFMTVDEREVLRGWYSLMTVYFQCLKVFIVIFRESWRGCDIGIFEKDVIAWLRNISALREQRVPWMGRHITQEGLTTTKPVK
jgi:hypothetical protein